MNHYIEVPANNEYTLTTLLDMAGARKKVTLTRFVQSYTFACWLKCETVDESNILAEISQKLKDNGTAHIYDGEIVS